MPIDTKFVEVILPLALPKLYSYRVPRHLENSIQVGARVVVQFGKGKKKYAALVRSISSDPPTDYIAKMLDQVLDSSPIVNEIQFRFWEWIASHYLCTVGEVMKAALPAQFKLSSETRVLLASAEPVDENDLDYDELTLLERLADGEILSLDEVEELKLSKGSHKVLKGLIEKGKILLEEEIKEKFRPKVETYIELEPELRSEAALQAAFDKLERAPKQLHMLMKFIELSRMLSDSPRKVRKTELQNQSDASSSVTKQLLDKKIFQLIDVEVGRIDLQAEGPIVDHPLSDDQQTALNSINEIHKTTRNALLYGVTASGKTEIYIELIKEVLAEGKQVLYLLPEIALTAQIVQRMRSHLGPRVGIFHSRLSQNERTEVWNKVLANDVGDHDVLLGARSALFLPFSNLGLIVVDEEHDPSFKQFDPAPRYNARDLSIKILAEHHDAKVVMGSATPALESLYNSKHGMYGLVELQKRFGKILEPKIEVADLKDTVAKRRMKGPMTPKLFDATNSALEKGEQVILFQNRRGFSSWLECKTCGWVPQCKSCDVSLTYHKYDQDLRCHYCGKRYGVPVECAACGSKTMVKIGSGTEQIEEQVQEIFPNARIARMDLDTTRGKNAHQTLINDLEDGSIDILIGTQMVTKGLDLENVTVVGVMNADRMLAFPDFRAHERAFQLMAQVSGRAGRRSKQGHVIIQSFDVDHPVIQAVVKSEHRQMYAREMAQRKHYFYPPYSRLVRITVKHKDKRSVEQFAHALARDLKGKLGDRVLGPESPFVERVRNYYLMDLLIKIERNVSPTPIKSQIKLHVSELLSRKKVGSLRITVDVDPM